MNLKSKIYLVVLLILAGLLYCSTANASESPVRTYVFHFDSGHTNVMWWNITAPIYANRGSVITFTLGFHVYPTGGMNLASLRLEVTATLDNSAKQQIYYSILLDGSYPPGTDRTFTPMIPVPSNTMLGSALNVSVYTDLNGWFLFPTEIRDINYDDLQSAYANAQSQISSLNQQIANLNVQIDSLTQELGTWPQQKDALNQQIASLNSEKSTLNGQVSSLNQQIDSLNQQIASLTSDKNALGSQVTNLQNQGILTNYLIMVLAAVAAVAIGVAAYMSYGKRKLSRKQKETEAPKS